MMPQAKKKAQPELSIKVPTLLPSEKRNRQKNQLEVIKAYTVWSEDAFNQIFQVGDIENIFNNLLTTINNYSDFHPQFGSKRDAVNPLKQIALIISQQREYINSKGKAQADEWL